MIDKLIISAVLLVLLSAGCTDRETEARRVKEAADAKARADAARKEMEALPKAFKSPPFFRLNEPEKKPDVNAPATKKTFP